MNKDTFLLRWVGLNWLIHLKRRNIRAKRTRQDFQFNAKTPDICRTLSAFVARNYHETSDQKQLFNTFFIKNRFPNYRDRKRVKTFHTNQDKLFLSVLWTFWSGNKRYTFSSSSCRNKLASGRFFHKTIYLLNASFSFLCHLFLLIMLWIIIHLKEAILTLFLLSGRFGSRYISPLSSLWYNPKPINWLKIINFWMPEEHY